MPSGTSRLKNSFRLSWYNWPNVHTFPRPPTFFPQKTSFYKISIYCNDTSPVCLNGDHIITLRHIFGHHKIPFQCQNWQFFLKKEVRSPMVNKACHLSELKCKLVCPKWLNSIPILIFKHIGKLQYGKYQDAAFKGPCLQKFRLWNET